MPNVISTTPPPKNEPIRDYVPGSAERASLKATLERMHGEEVDAPAVIGGEDIRTGDVRGMAPPHEHGHSLGQYHVAGPDELRRAVSAAREARDGWKAMPWEARASIFLKAADMLAGPWRDRLNGAAMLGISKTAHQAEIDAACELIDFLRFNVHHMERIYRMQPESGEGVWNRSVHRPLDGFVLAVTPFNFAAIAGNLPTAPAMMGNTVIWKPASSAVYVAHHVMSLLRAAGLPDGVINLVPSRGEDVTDVVLGDPDFAGLHFTGGTATFRRLWKAVSQRLDGYRSWPRLVGETGGKDFVFVHASADVDAVAAALLRGAFEFQGQKCSAASRVYAPESLWPAIRERLLDDVKRVRVGDVRDFRNFMGAVVDKRAYDKIMGFIERCKASPDVDILAGGEGDDREGYFVQPTIALTRAPRYETMVEEVFGPLLTVYVYPDSEYEGTLHLCDATSPYGLTGSVFATDRQAMVRADEILCGAAGNFYFNDKPTGAVVGQQPFGGSRASGTNDKAGSVLNMLRWTSARTVKETFVPPTDFAYPYMGGE